MKIDFTTGKVYYPGAVEELKEFIEKLEQEHNIKENKCEKEAVFQKTRHKGLPYGRLKYLFYCFLLMVDGLIGIVSFGQTQSIMAQKYLLSKWIMEEESL